MFLCEECLRKAGLQEPERYWFLRSRGLCEECRAVKLCLDFPKHLLPGQPTTRPRRQKGLR